MIHHYIETKHPLFNFFNRSVSQAFVKNKQLIDLQAEIISALQTEEFDLRRQ